MNAAFRVDPGLAFEMQREIEIERDVFTLFSFALDQTGAPDLRRCAANRLNELNGMDVLRFIRTDAEHAMCEAICRSNLFPTTFKSFARAALGRPEPKPKRKWPEGEGRWIKALFVGRCVCGATVEKDRRGWWIKEARQMLCEDCGKRAARLKHENNQSKTL